MYHNGHIPKSSKRSSPQYISDEDISSGKYIPNTNTSPSMSSSRRSSKHRSPRSPRGDRDPPQSPARDGGGDRDARGRRSERRERGGGAGDGTGAGGGGASSSRSSSKPDGPSPPASMPLHISPPNVPPQQGEAPSGGSRHNAGKESPGNFSAAASSQASTTRITDESVQLDLPMADLMAYLQVVANNSSNLPLTRRDDPELGRTVSSLTAEEYAFKCAAFVPSSVRILGGQYGKYGRVWDLPTSEVSGVWSLVPPAKNMIAGDGCWCWTMGEDIIWRYHGEGDSNNRFTCAYPVSNH